MMGVIWATRQYWFWLILISLAVMAIEFIAPWRKKQKHFRKQFGQDLLWLACNGHAVGITIAFVATYLIEQFFPAITKAEGLNLIAGQALWIQFLVFLILKDLLAGVIHNLHHSGTALWSLYKLPH